MGGAPSQILSTIWLGGQDVINDPRFFQERNISFVLSLGPAAPPACIPLVGREHINLPDVPSSDLSKYFARAVRFIAESRHVHNGGVYIHCAAGISRSTTCLCAYLMTHLGLSFQQTLAFVSSRRRAVCPNEGFTRQLKKFENSQERADLAEAMSAQCRNYQEIRQRDLEEMYRPGVSDGTSADVRRASNSVSGYRSARDHPSASPASRARTPQLSVEQEARQNAVNAVRQNVAVAEAHSRVGGRTKPELQSGNGDRKGDVGLGWLLGKESTPTTLVGRPSASARNSLPGSRRSSISQPVPSSRRASMRRR